MTTTVCLIADTREQNVIPFLETEILQYEWKTVQINTGDYVICNGSNILACIERKTYIDFAASFKDGRYANIKKMIDLREKHGCQLYFFIEGPQFPSINRKFSGIPFFNIQAAITSMMVNDGIFVIHTENENHTVKRLNDLLKCYSRKLTITGGSAAAESAAAPTAESAAAPAAESAAEPAIVIPECLTGRIEQTNDDLIIKMWSKLDGVSVVFGRILANNFSIADLATGKVPIKSAQDLKTATGRAITKKASDSLEKLENYGESMLSEITGLSKSMSEQILISSGGLDKLCNLSIQEMSAIKIHQKTRIIQLGSIKATKIFDILNYDLKKNL